MDAQLTKRLVENEAVFRKHNEKVESVFDELKQIASEEGQHDIAETDDMVLDFYCECSDEDCKKRVTLSLGQYSQIHANRNQFTIVPGHQVGAVEKIVSKTKQYYVVEKFIVPPVNPTDLNKTPINNV